MKLDMKTYLILLSFTFISMTLYFLTDNYIFDRQISSMSVQHAIEKTNETEEFFQEFSVNTQRLLLAVESSKILQNYLEDTDNRQTLEFLFSDYMAGSSNITQFRFINSFGIEEVRVDSTDKPPYSRIVPEVEHQDKSGRYYFKKLKNTIYGDVWFSELDLNVENSVVERPFNPTIRAGTPVYKNGSFRGVIILNYDAEKLFRHFLSDTLYDFILFDSEGYILKHHNEEKSWSKYRNPPFKIAEKYKKALESNKEGDFSNLDFVIKKMHLPFANELFILIKTNTAFNEKQNFYKVQRHIIILSAAIFYSVLLSFFFGKIIKRFSEDNRNLRNLTKVVHKQNRRMRRSQEQFDLATEGSEYGLWDWDIVENTVYFSKSWKEMFGYSMNDISNTPSDWYRLVHPDDLDHVLESVETYLSSEEDNFKVIYRMRQKDGDFLWVMSSGKAKFDEKGNPVRFVGFTTDINQIKELEQQLSNLTTYQERIIVREVNKNIEKDKQIMHQSRLAQMGEMINMIAHQWRQPLSAISSTSDNLSLKLMMDNFDKEMFQHEVNLISNYAQHLSKTIDDFRNFFKNNNEKQETTIEDIIEETFGITSMALSNKSIIVEKNYNSFDTLMTYPSEVKQVVLNLIKNAEDILIDKDVNNRQITINTYSEGSSICMEVRDNAGGIPEDILPKIFDPYFSTKTTRDGTGLGLYMSKMIIEEHCGGTIKAHNEDEGAVFIVKLPKGIKDEPEHN